MVKCKLSAVVCDFKHIINAWIDVSVSYFFGSLSEVGNHIFLKLGRLCNLVVIFNLRHWQIQHIRRLNIGNLFEHCNEFGQIKEFCKPCFHTITTAFGCKLHCRYSFTKGRRPAIEVLQTSVLERFILQISLHSIKFNH